MRGRWGLEMKVRQEQRPKSQATHSKQETPASMRVMWGLCCVSKANRKSQVWAYSIWGKPARPLVRLGSTSATWEKPFGELDV